MDSITLIIACGSSLVIGTGTGLYIGALFAANKIRRASADAWTAAERFHRLSASASASASASSSDH